MIRPSTLRGAQGLLVLFLLAVAPAGCGPASRDAVRECAIDADCGPAVRCVQGACQASRAPTADFALPAELATHRLVTALAVVTDPDVDDTVAGWSWTVTRVSAACDADVDVGDGPRLEAVFWCPGTYEVSLLVSDAAGAVSAPARRTVTVATLAGAPSVSAGPAVAIDHRCAGMPLRCELTQAVALSADGLAPLGGPLTYAWAALPPDPSRAAASATVTHSPTAGDALLMLSTAGGPISGAWRLRVRAQDALGNLAQAFQLVTVGNREPVVDATALALDHRYDGAYRVDGALAVPASDPDGDPVEVGLAMQEPAGSGCSATLTGAAAGATLALSCPAPGGLLAAGRAVVATATDVNGASVAAAVPVTALNRLPVLRPRAGAGLTTLALDHGVGPCPVGGGTCFLVSGDDPFLATDPDGDPITAVTLLPRVEAGRPTSSGAALTGAAGATFRFATALAFPAEFRSPTGESGFSLTATASDPFGTSAAAQPGLAIRILNRPPALAQALASVSTGHRYDAGLGAYLAAAELAAFVDPDGDPLAVDGLSDDPDCGALTLAGGVVSVSCRRDFAITPTATPTVAGFAGQHALTPGVSDGWDTTRHATTLVVENQPPTVASYSGAVEVCTCACPSSEPLDPSQCPVPSRWTAEAGTFTLPQRPGDTDGDPLRVTFRAAYGQPAGTYVNPASTTALPQDCAATATSPTSSVTVEVSVSDGVGSASGVWSVGPITCALEGVVCAPAAARWR